jgi:UDP-N-acetylmuramoylalanine--D-glutamate ligase
MQVVVGLGQTGYACVEYLVKRGCSVRVVDTREAPPFLEQLKVNYPNVPVELGVTNEASLLDAKTVIISPGVSSELPMIQAAQAHGVPCIGEIELFVQAAQAPIIAITGTNGKTTTTALIGHMLRHCGALVEVGGNIGVPALSLLERELPDYYVLELSSFQLETTHSLKAKIAVILNLSPDHMDRYPSLDEYRQAKQHIYRNCDLALCNFDEPILWSNLNLVQQVGFSVSGNTSANFYLDSQGMIYTPYGDTAYSLLTDTNALHPQNILVALAVGESIGYSFKSVCEGIKTFYAPAHRCQFIGSFNCVDYINDSKGTNAGAVIAALTALGPRYDGVVLIAGGDAKGSDLSSLLPYLKAYVVHLVLLGKDKNLFVSLFGRDISYSLVGSMAEAVQQAAQLVKPGMAVLLSPACASWDMFENYKARGNAFVTEVYNLQGE